MQRITLKEVAMMVECQVCGASSIESDTVQSCCNEDGTKQVPVHSSRLNDAKEQLAEARSLLREIERNR